ncbi:biotin transporter BioY [Paenirhodobacter populi]
MPVTPTTSPLTGPARFGRIARPLALCAAGVVVMTLAAKVQIPFWPVPMTLHTLAVMGFAVALGPRLAVAIFMGYLAAGAAGLPVFSGSPERGIGLTYLAGPTGGYLAGYLVASGLTGWLAAGRATLGRIGAMLAGLAAVYGIGAAWLAVYVPAGRILELGVAPFLFGDLVKIGLVAAVAGVVPGLLSRLRGRL